MPDRDAMPELWYLPEIEGAELIRYVRDRLFDPRTLDGNERRDLAEKLRLALASTLAVGPSR